MSEEIQKSFTEIYTKIEGWLGILIENLPNLLVAVVVMIASFYASKYVSRWVIFLVSKKIPQESISKLIGRISAILVVSLGLFFALGALDLSKTLNALLAGAGISGLVIGLALQGPLSNLLSGIVLSFRKKIQVGNWIETTGYAGEVVDISLNTLVLREYDNSLVVIPNKTIMDNPLRNYSLTDSMRVAVACGVGYESDLEKVENLVKKTLQSLEAQKEDTEIELYYTEFGDSSINFICRYWVDAKDARNRLEAKSMGIKAIKKAFDANDINIPFPIRTLEFNSRLNVNSIKANNKVLQN